MAWTIEAARKGGEVTLAKYGFAHYSRISKGRKPRARYQQKIATSVTRPAQSTTPTGRRLYLVK